MLELILSCVTVPGNPQDVTATALNSTTIRVEWKPPRVNDQNGVIRGYHVHVQEVRDEVNLETTKKNVFYYVFLHTYEVHSCYEGITKRLSRTKEKLIDRYLFIICSHQLWGKSTKRVTKNNLCRVRK